MDSELQRIVKVNGGLVSRRQHVGFVEWARTGRLAVLLPGIYVVPELADDPLIRIRAALLWVPDGILTGAAAAKVSFWPSIRLDTITMAVMTGRRSRRGFNLVRRAIPPDLVVRRAHLTYTSPALTTLDLVDICGGDGIDQALRVRATTLPRLHDALTRTNYRPGNRARRRMLLESRDHPWSRAEREGHALLHRAGIDGWQGNLWVDLPDGGCFVDIGFEKQKVAIEIDGVRDSLAGVSP